MRCTVIATAARKRQHVLDMKVLLVLTCIDTIYHTLIYTVCIVFQHIVQAVPILLHVSRPVFWSSSPQISRAQVPFASQTYDATGSLEVENASRSAPALRAKKTGPISMPSSSNNL